MGDPGGGSDFAGFYNHLGIPIAEWGFGGPAGTYHSQYDTFNWMEKFGDPGLLGHQLVVFAPGQLAAITRLHDLLDLPGLRAAGLGQVVGGCGGA